MMLLLMECSQDEGRSREALCGDLSYLGRHIPRPILLACRHCFPRIRASVFEAIEMIGDEPITCQGIIIDARADADIIAVALS